VQAADLEVRAHLVDDVQCKVQVRDQCEGAVAEQEVVLIEQRALEEDRVDSDSREWHQDVVEHVNIQQTHARYNNAAHEIGEQQTHGEEEQLRVLLRQVERRVERPHHREGHERDERHCIARGTVERGLALSDHLDHREYAAPVVSGV
jgi:hypothetical protein